MRHARIKGWAEFNVYHCMSRTVNGEMLFNNRDKAVMRKMLFQVAEFCGVEVLAYAVMTNHFHVLVRISDKADAVDDAELLRRYKILYPTPTEYQPMPPEHLEQLLESNSPEAHDVRQQLKERMGDISQFMKTFKQRFTMYFNKTYKRFGTLWCERFASVLVENSPETLLRVMAYIDLNPVRAGLVEDPKDYHFCSFSDLCASHDSLTNSVTSIYPGLNSKEARAAYRKFVFGIGVNGKQRGSGHRIDTDRADEVDQLEGYIPLSELLLHKVRHFARGIVIGGHEFVGSYLERHRNFQFRKHKRPPNPINEETESICYSACNPHTQLRR
ncbi:MAG: transposase [Opitutales bacterium]|nr:transposase [Opitutales bacterium]